MTCCSICCVTLRGDGVWSASGSLPGWASSVVQGEESVLRQGNRARLYEINVEGGMDPAEGHAYVQFTEFLGCLCPVPLKFD